MPQQRTVLITGCSSGGLGAGLAIALHKSGWRVIATARNPSKLEETRQAGIATHLELDVLSAESLKTCAEEVKELLGPDGNLDMLINNAGAGSKMPVLDLDLRQVRDMFELNVFSIISVTKTFMPFILKAPKSANPKVVINTSIASVLGGVFEGAYNASKAAAASLAESLRLELSLFDVQVIDLKTGTVKSNFFGNVVAKQANSGASAEPLPKDSIFQPAANPTNKILTSAAENQEKTFGDRTVWATGVAKELSKARPANHLWHGDQTTAVRIFGHLPVGWGDGVLKKMYGVDQIETQLRESQRAKM